MIEVKTLFADWHEVTKEQAKKFVLNMKNGITNMNNGKKNKYIKSKIRGATIEELLSRK